MSMSIATRGYLCATQFPQRTGWGTFAWGDDEWDVHPDPPPPDLIGANQPFAIATRGFLCGRLLVKPTPRKLIQVTFETQEVCKVETVPPILICLEFE